jgi:threonine dehydratase
MATLNVKLADIEEARLELAKLINPTPLLFNPWLSDAFQCQVFLKLENMHPIGSFKIRGATYRVSRLTKTERKRGVVAASAGNHAQGVAWGCAQFGVVSTIVMPTTAPLTKIQNTRALGAEVVLQGENYDQAFAYAKKLEAKTGAVFIPAYENRDVIAGQGTVGLELMEQLPDLDVVIGSMGGGGLMAGCGIVMKALRPQVRMVGTQASGSRSLVESIKKGKVVDLGNADTFADGIRVKQASPHMLRILKPVTDELLHADDEMIAEALLMLIEKAKIVAEGSAALPLAVLKKHQSKFKGKRVVLIVSGGNIDVNVLGRIIDRGLVRSGRRLRLSVSISDRPGSLAQLTKVIADNGANILQAMHERDTPGSKLNETVVDLTLETKVQNTHSN